MGRAQSDNRAVRYICIEAVLVACRVAARAPHSQPSAGSPVIAVEQLAHAFTKIARQERVQKRIQARIHVGY